MLEIFSQIIYLLFAASFSIETSNVVEGSAKAIDLTTNIDLYIKIAVGALTGIGTLIGIPLILLNYRKTSAEIKKLDIEAESLKNKLNQDNISSNQLRVIVDNSPNSNIQISTDPRFLAPLLLLIDFIFAWIILILANYFLSFFSMGGIKQLVLFSLAFMLLLPIIEQIIHVRKSLTPKQTEEEIKASIKSAKMIIYSIWSMVILVAGGFSILIATSNADNVTTMGWVISYIAGGVALLLLIMIPFSQNIIQQKLEKVFSYDDS